MTRPRLLFLCHLDPYGTERGASLRTRGILELLETEYEVQLLALDREAGDSPRRESRGMVLPLPAARGLAFLQANVRSLLTGEAYTRFVYESPVMRSVLRRAIETDRPSLVHVDSIDLAGYLPLLGTLPFALTHHNVESALMARQASNTRAVWRRAYMALQAGRIAASEREWAPRAAMNIMVSDEDADQLRRMAPRARTTVVANGVDTGFFRPRATTGSGTEAIFLGGLDYSPNREGVEWFLAEVAPRLLGSTDGYGIRIVGAASPADIARLGAPPAITLTGYVPDVRPCFDSAACAIVPLLTGGGTRVKILTAWSMGVPVVSTSIGCEGLAFEDGVHGFIRDDPAEFAEAVTRLLASPDRARAMGAAARAHVESRYSWKVLLRPLLDTYRGLAVATQT